MECDNTNSVKFLEGQGYDLVLDRGEPTIPVKSYSPSIPVPVEVIETVSSVSSPDFEVTEK